MNKDVKGLARSYVRFQKSKVKRSNMCPLGSFKTPDAHFDYVHMHLIGRLPDSSVYFFPQTCLNLFKRWPEAVPIKNILLR